jgi:hypothetical protein
MMNNPIGFLFYPKRQWQIVSDQPESKFVLGFIYPLIMGLLPCAAFYIGTTKTGWDVSDNENYIRLTTTSAFHLLLALYAAMFACLVSVGYSIHWMAKAYGSDASIFKGLAVSSYTATPLFIAGAIGLYPELWVNMVAAVLAVGWSVYLLYTGIPAVMHIPEERGFLYASAVLAVALVTITALLIVSVLLWDMGLMPQFTD